MNKAKLQTPIELTFWMIGLYVSSHAVLFCQGNAPIPMLKEPVLRIGDANYIMEWLFTVPAYYILGIVLWISAGLLIMVTGKILARLAVVGPRQLGLEMRESWIEEQKLARIESDRRKRRELRKKLYENKQGADNSSFSYLIIGAIIGGIFF